MRDLHDHIATRLGAAFDRCGFGGSSVDQLRAAADVSLRTLYRHFPSRDAMVMGALAVRHDAYLAALDAKRPSGSDGVLAVFHASGDWLAKMQGRGCLFLRAKAEHPETPEVDQLVIMHKQAVRDLIAERLDGVVAPAMQQDITSKLFILLEGQTFGAMTAPADAVTRQTLQTAQLLLKEASAQ